MRTTTRLRATTAAIDIHNGIHAHPENDVNTTTANAADDAWPLGKLLVEGVRTVNLSSPDVVGRDLRNIFLIPWFTTRLSTPSAAERTSASLRRWVDPMARRSPVACQTRLKSPTVLATPKTTRAARTVRRDSHHRSPAASTRVAR